jgi:RHS repeat-associated protein
VAAAGETITYIHTDMSGSPLAATNEAGNVIWQEDYSAYGERNTQQPGSEGQAQWFHGKEVDAATGLQYFGARYYDPAVGRFMGVDPVGFQEVNLNSFNRYAYGNNNPVKYVDPDGNLPILLLIPFGSEGGGFCADRG